jgi:L-aminopeptidase/D-esterase-like protein
MPKAIEDCVKKISGTNKKTGKPYTQSEKWAICTAAHEKKGKAEFSIEEFTEEEIDEMFAQADKSMNMCMEKMMNSGRAKTTEEAKAKCEAMMARSEYDLEQLEFIFTKIL